jgi:hypothetical protein
MLGLIILVAIASTVDACFMAMPREYHKVHPKLIWAIATAFILNLAASYYVTSAPLFGGLLSILALCAYFLVRAIAFIGLDLSFRAYAMENPVRRSNAGTILAWLASSLDALLVMGILASAFIQGTRSGLTVGEQKDYDRFILIALSGGLFITVAFLLAMNSNKNRVAAHKRAERKKTTDAAIEARKKQQASTATKRNES